MKYIIAVWECVSRSGHRERERASVQMRRTFGGLPRVSQS
jgi:hypothetical protein